MAESANKQLLSAVTEGQTAHPQPLLHQSPATAIGAAGSSRGGGGGGGSKAQQQPRRRLPQTQSSLKSQKKHQKKDSGRVAKVERKTSSVTSSSSGSTRQELRKSLSRGVAAAAATGAHQRDAEEAPQREVAAVVPDGQKRTSRRSSNFNYKLEDSEDDSDCGELRGELGKRC